MSKGGLPVQVHSEFALLVSEGILVVTSLLDPGTFVDGLVRENVESFGKRDVRARQSQFFVYL